MTGEQSGLDSSVVIARKLLSADEGRVSYAYQDSLGVWTIGVGHNIDKRRGGKLPEHIIDALLDSDIREKTLELDRFLPWWKDLDNIRQAVLISLCFNLGIAGLLRFKITLASIKLGHYAEAADELENSQPWASQVGDRAKRLAQMLRTGDNA